MTILENICDFIFMNLLVVGIYNTAHCLVVLHTRQRNMASMHTAGILFTVESCVHGYRVGYHICQHTEGQ